MDATEIKRLQSIANASKSQRTASTTVAKPKTRGRGGGLTAWLSELGGTGGAWAGGATGAAIGSAVPGIGTVIGGLIGAGIGGFAGGTAGKLAENKVRDDEFRLSQALGEGAMEGLFSAGPIKLGKIGAVGAKTLLKGAAKEGGEKLLEEGAKSAAKFGVKTTAREAIEESLGKSLFNKAGSSLRSDVVNPKVVAGVGGAQKEKIIADTVSKVPGLTSKSKYANLQGEMDKLTAEITPKLKAAKKTASSDTLLSNIRKNADESTHFLAGDPTYERQLASVLADVSAKTGNTSELTAKQLFDYKTGMQMDSVFKKLDKGADLNPKEAARLAVWSSLDDSITEAAPEVKKLTKQQSILMQGAQGLKKNSEKTMGIPLLGIKSTKLEQGVQAGREITGRVLQGGKKAVPTTGQISIADAFKASPRPTAGMLGRVVAGSQINSAINPSPVADAPVDETIDPTTGLPVVQEQIDPTTGLPVDTAGLMMQDTAPVDEITQLQTGLKQAALAALKAGDSKGLESIIKTAGLLESLGALGNTEETKPVKKTEGQRARDGAARLTEKAIGQLEKGSINTGLISGNLEKAKGVFGKADPESLEFNTTISNLLAVIAKANAGTSFTAGEKALLQQYAPKVGDSGQVLRTKLAALRDVFASAQEAEYGNEYQPDVTIGAI